MCPRNFLWNTIDSATVPRIVSSSMNAVKVIIQCSVINGEWSGQTTRPVITDFALRLLRFSLQGALKRLIQSGFGLVVFRLRNQTLLALHFELEQFFFDPFHQHGAGARRGSNRMRRENIGRLVVVFFLSVSMHGRSRLMLRCCAGRGLLPGSHIHSANHQHCSEAPQNPPAIFLQRIGSIDWRPQSAAGPRLTLGVAAWRATACLAAFT